MREASSTPLFITLRQGGFISTHEMTLGMTQIFRCYVPDVASVSLIGVMKNVIFGQQTSSFHRQKRNGRKKLWRRASKDSLKPVWFHTTWHQECNRKREVVHVLMRVFIHLHYPMPTNALTHVNTYILNLGVGNMLIDGYISLSQEKSYQVRKICFSLRFGRKTKDTMCLKFHLMKPWLKVGKLGN